MDLTLPTPDFLSSLWNRQGLTSPWDALFCTRWGHSCLSSQAIQEALLPAAGSAVLPSCGCAGNSFPFVFPSDPICSATAQIQFRRRVPPASSHALSLRNHSNPPKQRTLNLNKPSDISLAGQDAEQDSLHACLFETLWLFWPLSNPPLQSTLFSQLGQTLHFLVDLATVLSQQDISIFCDPKPSFFDVQLCPFIEINPHRI